MAEIAFSFGGTVDKFIGDSVVVILGAPLDTDPALQANPCVQMALASSNENAERRMDRKGPTTFGVAQSHGHPYWWGNGREFWQR